MALLPIGPSEEIRKPNERDVLFGRGGSYETCQSTTFLGDQKCLTYLASFHSRRLLQRSPRQHSIPRPRKDETGRIRPIRKGKDAHRGGRRADTQE